MAWWGLLILTLDVCSVMDDCLFSTQKLGQPGFFMHMDGTTQTCVVCADTGNFMSMLKQVPVKTWIFFLVVFVAFSE